MSTSHTLLLRFSGPMQSWGSRSRFRERDTEREPTKSGVIGLVCAAMGRPREASLDDLVALRVGVRVDREGELESDYQTALEVRKADPSLRSDTALSNRYYLADAVFLVGLESSNLGLLEAIDAALRKPVWPLCLGRKAFVPGEPVRLDSGLRQGQGLEEALKAWPALCGPAASQGAGQEVPRLRLQLECREGEEGEPRQDVPITFVAELRSFAVRRIRFTEIERPASDPAVGGALCT